MAFLGSVGKLFGISTPEAANIAAAYATGGIGQAALTTLGSLGDQPAARSAPSVDVSPRPAGVDSPATLSRTSQTSMAPSGSSFVSNLGGAGAMQQPSQAFIGGGFVPSIVQGAGRALSRLPSGGLIGAAGTLLAADTFVDIFGNEKKLIITRKLQRDVKKVFMMSGGDITFVAQNSGMLFAKNLSEDQILQILFKTFKNQGPYVTKAAVRKTRSTIRKMETLCDLKDRLCPPKPARRRAPARRMSTSITQVK